MRNFKILLNTIYEKNIHKIQKNIKIKIKIELTIKNKVQNVQLC